MCELLDLVDDNDRVIGVHDRSWFYNNDIHFYRVINVFCTNSEGKILLQQKSDSCIQFAGLYDFSVGGHVQSNESYETAACREIYEEIGLKVNKKQLVQIAYLKYPNELQTSSFSKLYYLCIQNYKPILSSETQKFQFLTDEEIRYLMTKKKFKSDYEALFNLFCDWRVKNE